MKQELLGVAFNRIMRMDIHTGDHTKTWRFNTMKAWNVNWEVMLITELTIGTNLLHTKHTSEKTHSIVSKCVYLW